MGAAYVDPCRGISAGLAGRHEHDQEAFEQRLEEHHVTPEDPARRSIV